MLTMGRVGLGGLEGGVQVFLLVGSMVCEDV